MAEPANRIPPAILKMLGDNEWRPTEGHSLFEQVWGDETNGYHRERKRDPSFYYFLKRDLAENNNGVSGKGSRSLVWPRHVQGIAVRDIGCCDSVGR
jgi:hypothetical protein